MEFRIELLLFLKYAYVFGILSARKQPTSPESIKKPLLFGFVETHFKANPVVSKGAVVFRKAFKS